MNWFLRRKAMSDNCTLGLWIARSSATASVIRFCISALSHSLKNAARLLQLWFVWAASRRRMISRATPCCTQSASKCTAAQSSNSSCSNRIFNNQFSSAEGGSGGAVCSISCSSDLGPNLLPRANFLNSTRTASGETPSRKAVFWAYLSIKTTLPVLCTASAIPPSTARRPLSVVSTLVAQSQPRGEQMIQRANGSILSGVIRIETEHHFLDVAFQNPRVVGSEGRPLWGDDVLHARHVAGDQIKLAFADNRALGVQQG